MPNLLRFAIISLSVISINFFSKYFNMDKNLVSFDYVKNNLNNYDLILDVRTNNEFLQGSHPKAINIPLQELSDNKTILNLPLNTSILVFCRTGIRANQAVQILKQIGFTNINYIRGSYLDIIN